MTDKPCYIDIKQARKVLAERGINLSDRQMKRACEMDSKGRRKLPFFIDPIDKKLKIDKATLLQIYAHHQDNAIKNALYGKMLLHIE